MFKNLTIRKKLGVSFGVIILLILAFSIGVFTILNKYRNDIKDIKERIEKVNYAHNMKDEIKDIVTRVPVFIIAKNQEERDKITKLTGEKRKKYAELFKKITEMTYTEQGRQLLKNIENTIKETAPYTDKIMKLAKSGNQQEAIKVYNTEYIAQLEKLYKTLDVEVEYHKEKLNKKIEELLLDIEKEFIAFVIVSLLIIIISILFTIFISRAIKQPVTEIKEALGKMAKGDLSVQIKIKTKDEMGIIAQSLQEAIMNIKHLIEETRNIAISLASSSEELSSTTEEISQNLKHQTDRANQIASAAEEMSQTISHIAQNTSNIAELSITTANVAGEGRDITKNTAKEIKVIEEALNQLSKVINGLGDSSRQIGEIVTVIKDIADQTNLLALNAAIEAARAGEQGRGFAVVADEIRKLAERTTKATDEISEMINGIQKEVDAAENSMEDATKKMLRGVELSNKSAEMLGDILTKAKELQTMIQQIASSTEQMSSVTENITQDIGTIANGSKEIFLAVEQSAQTASDVAKSGVELKSAIEAFKI